MSEFDLDSQEDAEELAALVGQLPTTARLYRAVDPAYSWDDTTTLIWMCEYELRVLIWQRTKDGAHGQNKPEPLPAPGKDKKLNEADVLGAKAQVDAVLKNIAGGDSDNG